MPRSQKQIEQLIEVRKKQRDYFQDLLDVTDEIIAGKSEAAACRDHHIRQTTYRHFISKKWREDYREIVGPEESLVNTTEAPIDAFVREVTRGKGVALDDFEEAYEIVTDKALSPRQQRVIYLKYREDYTYEEIGKELGITRERARQLVLKALSKLRHPRYADYFIYGVEGAKAKYSTKEIQSQIATLQLALNKAKRQYEELIHNTNTLTSLIDKVRSAVADKNISEETGEELIGLLKEAGKIIEVEGPAETLSLDTPIEVLSLSVRSYNCLRRNNIKTIGELVACDADSISKIRGMGRKCLKEIIDKLDLCGYRLSGGYDL